MLKRFNNSYLDTTHPDHTVLKDMWLPRSDNRCTNCQRLSMSRKPRNRQLFHWSHCRKWRQCILKKSQRSINLFYVDISICSIIVHLTLTSWPCNGQGLVNLNRAVLPYIVYKALWLWTGPCDFENSLVTLTWPCELVLYLQ